MAINTVSTLSVELQWVQTDTGLGENQTRDAVTMARTTQLLNGSGTGLANTVYYGTGTLGIGGNDVIDLTSLSRNIFGSNITKDLSNGKIKFLAVENTSTGVDQFLQLDNTLTNGNTQYATDCVIPIQPSGILAFSNPLDGWTVDSSNRYLRINDGGNGCQFEIGIVAAT